MEDKNEIERRLEKAQAAKEKLEGLLLNDLAEAKNAVGTAMKEQERLCDKLMIASGGTLGLLVTLTLSSGDSVDRIDVVGPAALLAGAFLLSSFGLWSRIHANLKQSNHINARIGDMQRMMREAEEQLRNGTIGKVSPPAPGPLPPFPERWVSVLDRVLFLAFGAFTTGVLWAGWNLLT